MYIFSHQNFLTLAKNALIYPNFLVVTVKKKVPDGQSSIKMLVKIYHIKYPTCDVGCDFFLTRMSMG